MEVESHHLQPEINKGHLAFKERPSHKKHKGTTGNLRRKKNNFLLKPLVLLSPNQGVNAYIRSTPWLVSFKDAQKG